MNVVPLLASTVNLGMGLAMAAVAIGLTVRVAALAHGAKRIFPRH
jgi:hypothetical protein